MLVMERAALRTAVLASLEGFLTLEKAIWNSLCCEITSQARTVKARREQGEEAKEIGAAQTWTWSIMKVKSMGSCADDRFCCIVIALGIQRHLVGTRVESEIKS